MNKVDKVDMPPNSPINGQRLIRGAKRSRQRLAELKFDPIEKLVMLYKKLEEEDKWYVELRKATSVKVLGKDGKPQKTLRYSAVAHSTVLAQLEKIGNDLLRYGYGRVSETVNVNNQNPSPLLINLSGKKVIEHDAETITVTPEIQFDELKEDF